MERMPTPQRFSFLSPERAVRAAKIRERMQVADFHAGSGFFSRAAARAVGRTGRVWAIDVSSDTLARVKSTAEVEGLENISVLRGNIERRGGTLLPEAGIDAVMLANALFTAEDKEGVIEEAWRVLKPSGCLLVIDWKDSFGGLGPHPTHVITEDDAKRLIVRGGFELLEEIPAGDYHWGLLFRKKL